MKEQPVKPTKKVVNTPKVIAMSQTIASTDDPNGSYTGVPLEKGEMPVQDADDL